MPLAEVIARVQSQYDGITDLQAHFIQETTLKSMQRMERKEEGIVSWKKPQRMRWQYKKPQIKELIINRGQAWLYVPEDHVAYTQKPGAVLKSQTAVRLFSGFVRLQEDFQIHYARPAATDKEGNYLLTLTPKDKNAGTADIVVTVDPERYLIRQLRFLDAAGNVTRLSLKNIRTNSHLSDQLFLFRPPPGVEVFPMP
jgi:outer membrane lipoprotein carrier protein